jgi:hypothetical protein
MRDIALQTRRVAQTRSQSRSRKSPFQKGLGFGCESASLVFNPIRVEEEDVCVYACARTRTSVCVRGRVCARVCVRGWKQSRRVAESQIGCCPRAPRHSARVGPRRVDPLDGDSSPLSHHPAPRCDWRVGASLAATEGVPAGNRYFPARLTNYGRGNGNQYPLSFLIEKKTRIALSSWSYV